MNKYELWCSEKEQSYTLLIAGHNSSELEEDAELLTTFEASSYIEACFKQNEFLGW